MKVDWANIELAKVSVEADAVRVKYNEVLPYKGPKTASRLMYLLHHSPPRARTWSSVLHNMAVEVREGRLKAEQGLILVHIVETLSAK